MNVKKYHIKTFIKLVQNLKRPYKSLLDINTHTHTLIVLKNNTKFWVRNFMDLWVIAESYLNKDYETNVIVGKNWNILDIGAGIGDFSILAAQRSSQNTVYAIEPFPSSYRLLSKNIKLNSLKNIISLNMGLASKSGRIKFDINQKNLGNNKSVVSSDNTLLVKAVTLAELIEQNDLNRIDLIKSDCEGAEFDIFLNAPMQTYSKIDRIVMEYHLFNPENKLVDLVQKFHQNKYQVKVTPNPVHTQIGFLYAFKN